MILEDLLHYFPLDIEIRVVGLEETDAYGETVQRCYSCGKLIDIEYDMLTVNVGNCKLGNAKVLQIEPISENCLKITILD